jgi:hypothetical protein
MAGGDPAVGQRAAAGAEHLAVEVAVDPAIDGAGTGRGQRPAEQGQHDEARRRPATVGHHHSAERGDQQQRNDARFDEADVVAHDLTSGPARLAGRTRHFHGFTRSR